MRRFSKLAFGGSKDFLRVSITGLKRSWQQEEKARRQSTRRIYVAFERTRKNSHNLSISSRLCFFAS